MTRRAMFTTALLARRAAAAPKATVESISVASHQPRHYHAWATVAQRKNGELIASYSGGREGHIDPFGRVEFIRSTDQGMSWSWPQVIMDTPIDDRDSGILETPRGTLLATTFTSVAFERVFAGAKDWEADRVERWKAAIRAASPERRQALRGAWMIRSEDGGVSWSVPYRVPVTSPHGPIALRDGRLLYPGKKYPDAGEVGVCESTDDGGSWRWIAGIPSRPSDSHMNYHELHGVEAADGRIVIHVRNHNKENERETLQTESSDGGRTWSTPRPIGVWGLPSHLLRLRDGRLLMSYGYRRAPRGNHVRVSEDHGKTWSGPLVLSDDGTGDLGYPSTVQLSDNEFVTMWYESKRSGTTAVKLPEPPLSVLRLARWRLS